MAVTQKVTLYNNKFTVPPVINAVQNDTDRQVEAYFGDFTLQVGMTGKLSFIRSDGTHYEVSATLSTANNTATAELDQALTQAGVTQAQLKITASGNVGSTFTFMIKVQPDVAGISQQQDGYSAEELAQGIADNASAIDNIENVELPKKADQDGYYEDLTSGTSLAVLGTPTTESVPYLFRRSASIGVRESDKLVGGTIAWNQLANVPNDSWSPSAGHVSITYNSNGTIRYVSDGQNSAIDAGKVCTTTDWGLSITENHVYLFSLENDLPSGLVHKIYESTSASWTGSHGLYSGKAVSTIVKTSSGMKRCQWYFSISANSIVDEVYIPQIIDLTQLLGSTIADYVHTLESGTAGAGIAWLRANGFGFMLDGYHAYDAGSLQSVKTSAHKTVGFNQWDEEWENGLLNLTTGQPEPNASYFRSKNYCPIVPSTTFYAYKSDTNITQLFVLLYDANKNYLGYKNPLSSSGLFTTDANARYFKIRGNTASSNGNICVNFSGAKNGTYEPYEPHVYPISDIDLRGVLKLDANNKLYYDGDEYKSDGTVLRRFKIVDLGSLTWSNNASFPNTFNGSLTDLSVNGSYLSFVCQKYDKYTSSIVGNQTSGIAISDVGGLVYIKDPNYSDYATFKTAMSGVYLVYELATPTAESTDPFHDPQICSPYGTEEYVDTRDVPVPVGHETEYYSDPVAEIERVSVQVPVPPTANGTYRLTCVVSGGVPTYSWTS